MLTVFQQIFVQDAASAQMLKDAGVHQVSIGGDTRFDRVWEAAQQPYNLPAAADFCKYNKILIAGSTWPEDETILAAVLSDLPTGWKLILVPHEVHEAHISHIERIFTDTIRWTRYKSGTTKKVLIVDTVGQLLQLYHYGTVAWVGGGFGKEGIHNVLEPAAMGLPVLHGPVYHQFLEAAGLLAAGGAAVCEDATELTCRLHHWNKNPQARTAAGNVAAAFVATHTGATNRIMDYLAAKAWPNKS